jgi:hypothetical protein
MSMHVVEPLEMVDIKQNGRDGLLGWRFVPQHLTDARK